jgi:hypothetical protein
VIHKLNLARNVGGLWRFHPKRPEPIRPTVAIGRDCEAMAGIFL